MGSEILLAVTDSNEDALAIHMATGEDHQLLVAADAAQCLQLLRQSPVVILVSERVSSDARVLCGEIRKDPAATQIPLLLLGDAEASPEIPGVDAVLPRPLDGALLRAWLHAGKRIAEVRRCYFGRAGIPVPDEVWRAFSKLSHAVNNPLQSLYANVDILMLNAAFPQELEAVTTEIIMHAGQVAKLVAEASKKAKQVMQATSGGPASKAL